MIFLSAENAISKVFQMSELGKSGAQLSKGGSFQTNFEGGYPKKGGNTIFRGEFEVERKVCICNNCWVLNPRKKCNQFVKTGRSS